MPASGIRNGRFRHGLRDAPEYQVWKGMKQRCENPKHKSFNDYGGRGIRVCQRWRDSFAAFLEDMGNRPSPRHNIDRIDNNGDYEPGNCQWVLRRVNNRNRRVNHLLTFNGRTQTMTDWAAELGISLQTLAWRLNTAKWPAGKALSHGRRDSRRTRRT